MAKKLTAEVLQGISYNKTIEVEINQETFEVDVRPLTSAESYQIEALLQQGLNIKMKPSAKGKMSREVDINTDKQVKGKHQADVKAVALGTVDDSLDEDTVKKLPSQAVKQIAQEILQISGIGNQKAVQDFVEGEENPSHKDGKQ